MEIQIQHAFACDNDEAVQKFIMLNHSPGVIIAATESLGDRVTPVINKEVVSFVIPTLDIFIAGFICKGRSKKNNNREGPTAVRERLGSTGSSFDEIGKHIEEHKPRAVILENVVAQGDHKGTRGQGWRGRRMGWDWGIWIWAGDRRGMVSRRRMRLRRSGSGAHGAWLITWAMGHMGSGAPGPSMGPWID